MPSLAVAGSVGATTTSRLQDIRWSRRLRTLRRPSDDTLILVVLGDTMLVESNYYAAPNATRTLFGLCRDADLTFATLSQTLADFGAPTPKDVVIAPTNVIDDFAAAGVDVMSLATNHLLDAGASGLRETQAALAKVNIATVGGGQTLEEAKQSAVRTVRGQSVAFLAFHAADDWSKPRGSRAATGTSPGVAPIRLHRVRVSADSDRSETLATHEDIVEMERLIEGAGRQHDVVVVALDFHSTDADPVEAGGAVPSGMQQLARAAVDAGADVVVGTGRHWLYPLERYGDGYIAYGLGNFFFQLFENGAPASRYSLFPETQDKIAKFLDHTEYFESVVLRAVLQEGALTRIDFIPFALSPDGDPSLVDDARARPILRRLMDASASMKTELQADGWHAWIENEPA